ncbi:FimB/Mfa2 family fimbrial subunit [Mucilaginibacter sp. JRF]|uniref:FimB/Mfa2 family fimbrial subunit n=1 Tax=Mucilaginibacter sp. JRF TaxID=2780088 RepID=UPI00187F954A|nr:FimB/Mfa2 family fimbrial subunit [Mucilaginibacter sp. JRF]MBE9586328.1 FimB/Mfa2 family fimbrial subunit [Mucilaginibacter sp. JRF]
MKKIIIGLCVTSLIASGCKRENKPGPETTDGKKYNISFNVTGFTQQHQNLSANAVDDSLIYVKESEPQVKVLSVRVYNDQGTLVNIKGSADYQSDFGNLSMELSSGNYTAYFFGAINDDIRGLEPRDASYTTQSEVIDDGTTGLFFYQNTGSIIQFRRESFFNKLDFTVSATSGLTHPVQIQRIVAKVIVQVEDAIPANLKSISVNVDSTYKEFAFKGTYEREKNGTLTIYQIPASLYQKKGRKFAFYTLVDPNSLNKVSITCTFNGTNNTTVKTIENVPLNPNAITILSGNLFGGTGLKVDTAWNSEVIYKSF